MSSEQKLIFVSCGQSSEDEKALGEAVCNLIREITSFEPYYAQMQSTFEGLTQNVFGALNRCVGFIGIIHHRGNVETRNGAITRASVWIEQETAIAAFLQQMHGRQIQAKLFIQKGIAREGVRGELSLNPTEFEHNEEVINQWC